MSYQNREIVQFGLSRKHKLTKSNFASKQILWLIKYTPKLPQYFIKIIKPITINISHFTILCSLHNM